MYRDFNSLRSLIYNFGFSSREGNCRQAQPKLIHHRTSGQGVIKHSNPIPRPLFPKIGTSYQGETLPAGLISPLSI